MSEANGSTAEETRKVRLEELVIPFTGFWGSDQSSAEAQQFLLLGVGNVTNEGELDLKGATKRYLTREEMGGVAEEGDLVVVKSSGSAANIRSGKTAICPAELSGKIACSNFMMRLKVKRDVADPYLLWLILNSQAAKKFIRKIVGASTYPNIKWGNYRRFEFELPPLKQQQRVAARLREQLSILTEARAALEAQLRAADALPAANLRAVFESEEAKSWVRQPLEDSGVIAGGVTLGRNLAGRATRNVSYLRVANVKDGHLDLTTVKTTPATEEEIAACRLQRGDILLTEGGDPDKLGRGTFWNEELSECIHQNHIFRVRFDQRVFEPRFVAYQLGSSYGKAYFLRHAKQTTGIATINRRVLGAFPLMKPSLNEQHEIAALLDAERAGARALREVIQQKLGELKKLPTALLRSVFNPGSD